MQIEVPKEGGAGGVLEQKVGDRRGCSKREGGKDWVWNGTSLETLAFTGSRNSCS